MILCVFMRIIISYNDRVTFIMLVDIILNKDCLTGLAELPSGSVDLVFADPPYNLQLTGELTWTDQSVDDGQNNSRQKFD